MIVSPLLSAIHINSVIEEMGAAPVNTLNPQRTALIVANYCKVEHLRAVCDKELVTIYNTY